MLKQPLLSIAVRSARTTLAPRTTHNRLLLRTMATVREDSIPHVVRTAHEQRLAGTWNATLSEIEQVNSTIRLLRLRLVDDAVGTVRRRSGTVAPLPSSFMSPYIAHPLDECLQYLPPR